jgi:hypothetical protein
MHTYMHNTHAHAYIHAQYTRTCIHVYIHAQYTRTCIHAYIHTCTIHMQAEIIGKEKKLRSQILLVSVDGIPIEGIPGPKAVQLLKERKM